MKKQPGKTVIIIAGPTAVGKTALAIDITRHYNTSIISADSRQCFRELNIGVARPSIEELQQVEHYFIATHSITEEVTAVTFEEYALKKVNELFEKHDVVVMTGGTGLYIRAFCEGLDEIPEIPVDIRQTLMREYDALGIDWLRNQVKEKDPEFFAQGENQNPARLLRALEVKLTTGESILHFRKGNKKQRDFDIIKIGLELPREELYTRINQRVDKMMEMGLLEEVKGLMQYRELNALQTVGYSELFDYIDENTSLERAIELIKRHTRRYAKRQMTWFKKDQEFQWFSPSEGSAIINLL